jgi:luciferase family oxidoreductase group 1
MLKLGILDQSPIAAGETPVEAMRNTIELAKAADRWGYSRYWVSEHHDTAGLAGSSPEVLIPAIAAQTARIRVGSGGVLLPHYSPYKVAENFRVLEALYPGRIDLGIGRAPGGMPAASRALRYGRLPDPGDNFPEVLRDLAGFLRDDLPGDHPFAALAATPQVATVPDIWLLGSSDYSGFRASELGAGFSFAHFINGDGGQEVVRRYRKEFRPGPLGGRPRVNVCVIVICADSDEEAERLAKPLDLRYLLFEKGEARRPVPTLEEADRYPYSETDRLRIQRNRRRMIVGGPERVKRGLETFAESYGTDEVLVMTMTPDFASRLASYRKLAELFLRQPAG